MEELIQRVTAAAGIDAGLAEKAIGMILAFIKKEAPGEEAGALMAAMPGAEALAEANAGGGGGMVGGLMGMMGGGGVMGLGASLMGAGLSMGQIQGVSKEVFAFAKEKAGEDTIGAIVGSIPGLGQFV